MSTNKYTIEVEKYAERHYIKKFKKKYKSKWDLTFRSIEEEFKRLESLFETSIAEKIHEKGDIIIAKTEFRVAGTKQAKKSSGNRCVIAIHQDTQIVKILLIYHKNDLLGNGSETAKWKRIIKENYREYGDLV